MVHWWLKTIVLRWITVTQVKYKNAQMYIFGSYFILFYL